MTIARSKSKLPYSFMLLGIDCGHLHSYEPVLESDKKTETGMFVKSNTGMAVVIGAWKLRELLDSKEVKRMREQIKRKAAGATSLDIASDKSMA